MRQARSQPAASAVRKRRPSTGALRLAQVRSAPGPDWRWDGRAPGRRHPHSRAHAPWPRWPAPPRARERGAACREWCRARSRPRAPAATKGATSGAEPLAPSITPVASSSTRLAAATVAAGKLREVQLPASPAQSIVTQPRAHLPREPRREREQDDRRDQDARADEFRRCAASCRQRTAPAAPIRPPRQSGSPRAPAARNRRSRADRAGS